MFKFLTGSVFLFTPLIGLVLGLIVKAIYKGKTLPPLWFFTTALVITLDLLIEGVYSLALVSFALCALGYMSVLDEAKALKEKGMKTPIVEKNIEQ